MDKIHFKGKDRFAGYDDNMIKSVYLNLLKENFLYLRSHMTIIGITKKLYNYWKKSTPMRVNRIY